MASTEPNPFLSSLKDDNENDINLESSPNIAVKNRYSILSTFHLDPRQNSDADSANGSPEPRPSSDASATNIGVSQRSSALPSSSGVRPPPLYIQNFDGDLPKLAKSLEKYCRKNFNLKYLEYRIRIQVSRMEDFHDLKTRLQLANLAFHTFTANSQKVLVTVLKGLSRA